MRKKKLPDIGNNESIAFCVKWDESTHEDKLYLCKALGVSYQQGKDFRSACRVNELPDEYHHPKSDSWEGHLDAIRAMDRLIAYHQKSPTEVSIRIETELPIAIVKTADWQLGEFGVDYDSFERDMNAIEQEPGLYCDIGGDGYQNIIQPSKVGSSHNQTPIAVQKGLFVLTLKKLKDKIKTVRTGNHNYWATMAMGEDWDAELCHRLKLVYLKHHARIYWRVGEQIYPELALHKSRYNSSFNLTHNCKQNQRMHFPDARIITIEHQHEASVEHYRYNENECVALRTGTYAVYDDFAQQNGFFGSYVANPTVILFPKKDKILAFKDMYDAIDHLRYVRTL